VRVALELVGRCRSVTRSILERLLDPANWWMFSGRGGLFVSRRERLARGCDRELLRPTALRRRFAARPQVRSAPLLTWSACTWYASLGAICTDDWSICGATGKDGLMPGARRPPARAVPLPMRTPISELGLTAAEARRLTPGARKLTKGDLIAMMEGKIPRAAQGLTLRDLTSISNVYAAAARSMSIRPAPTPACCCCCCARGGCCCCCATLTTEI